MLLSLWPRMLAAAKLQLLRCKLSEKEQCITSSVSPRSRSTRADFIQILSLANVFLAFARMPRARSISLFSNSILNAASQICSLSAPQKTHVKMLYPLWHSRLLLGMPEWSVWHLTLEQQLAAACCSSIEQVLACIQFVCAR